MILRGSQPKLTSVNLRFEDVEGNNGEEMLIVEHPV